MTDLILYHGMASTCSKKVRLALAEKGLAYESRLLDLSKQEQKAPSYLARNPKGVVPTLVHAGRPIVESSVVLEYIEDVFPQVPLRPAEPADRASMRLWLRFSDEVAHPSVSAPTWKFMQEKMARARGPVPAGAALPKPRYSEAEVERAVQSMANCIAQLDGQLRYREWLVADHFTLADCAMLPYAVRIRNLHPDFVDPVAAPGVSAWLDRAAARASFSVAMDVPNDPRAAAFPNF